MSLATLLNIPTTPDQFGEFTFSNQDEHRLIAMAVNAQAGSNVLNIYPLDPVPEYALATWFQLHQQAHNEMAIALGIGNFDISDVDFKNAEQTAAWIRLHFSMHQQAAAILGLS